MSAPPPPEETPSLLAPDTAQRVAVPAPAQRYELATIFSSLRGATAADLTSAPARIAASPCLRPALLWSVVIGGLLGLHRRRMGGALRRCLFDGYAGGAFTLCWSWFACRQQERDKALTMNAYYASLQERGGAGGGGGAAPQSASAPAGEHEEWRRALERLAPRSGEAAGP